MIFTDEFYDLNIFGFGHVGWRHWIDRLSDSDL